jgi:membrane protease YdiL (CAAX protease family)
MVRTDSGALSFDGGVSIPVATYLLAVCVLSILLVVFPGESPPPLLGMAWGVFLVLLTLGAFRIEGNALRMVLPSARALLPAIGVLLTFWGLYNLVAFALASAGVVGFEATWSRVAAHPLPYLGALCSSFLFTALPEELVFRSYLQSKVSATIGGDPYRVVAAGVAIVAVLFALFHLPRWVLASGHGVGVGLAVRLSGLVLAGFAYGVVYALTGNLWLVASLHATINYPPLLVTMHLPADLHFVAGLVEYVILVGIVYASVRITSRERTALFGLAGR